MVRLFFIQVIEHNVWVEKASAQQTLLETIVAKRGGIYMMDGDEPVQVVMNQKVYSIIIDPQITEKDALKELLEKYAKDYVTADIDSVYEVEGLRYSVVAKNIPRETAAKISEEKVGGIWFQENNKREYAEGEMAAQALGFVNADGVGQYGIEGALNEKLAGKNGLLKTVSDVNNIALSIGSDNVKIPAVDGEDVVLTLDRSLQKKTEESLANALARNTDGATNAAAIIMDPNTGEVLSMASVPTYDPANYDKVQDWTAYLNYVTEVPYEPASVCKTFVFAAALNEGVMSPMSTYYNTGSTVVETATINNASKSPAVYGTINMQTALSWSLNTGSIQALKWLGGDPENVNEAGRQKLYDYYQRFRLGKPTGIEVSEADGIVHSPNEEGLYAPNLTYAEMTFGQGTSLTMVQVASAFSGIINGGYMVSPTMIKGVMKDGKLVANQYDGKDDYQVISSDTSATMRQMLHEARSLYLKKDNPGYYLGGKSGTGQVYLEDLGRYSEPDGETTATYIGFGGVEGELPKYVIMVKI
ncbi:penicillin-binding protein 2, partial [Candidatus Saccharibacteria bacterium]|nr:penicillin-binding protein 2 [Candidatus Saccharibacteria bacterium]